MIDTAKEFLCPQRALRRTEWSMATVMHTSWWSQPPLIDSLIVACNDDDEERRRKKRKKKELCCSRVCSGDVLLASSIGTVMIAR